eukprot:5597507-Ditylum_brightwellii.AAC.1
MENAAKQIETYLHSLGVSIKSTTQKEGAKLVNSDLTIATVNKDNDSESSAISTTSKEEEDEDENTNNPSNNKRSGPLSPPTTLKTLKFSQMREKMQQPMKKLRMKYPLTPMSQ